MAIPTIPSVSTLMEAGVHFGHASGKWHPRMKPYIFATRDKLHIIDLEKTRLQLESVLPILEDRVRSGKIVVLVGTKKQAAPRIKEIGESLNIPYVNIRWLGGTLTNFNEMQKSISRMKRTEAFLASEESVKLIKKERVMLENELKRMNNKFGGLRNLARKPDVVFVVDPSNEHNAIKECIGQGMELFAIVDTNSDPALVHHLIPANDEGVKSLEMILGLVEQTIANGQKLISVKGDIEKDDSKKDDSKKEEVVAEAVETKEVKKEEAAKPVKEEVKDDKADKKAVK